MATEISATETPTETHHHTHKVKIKTPSMGDMGMDPTLSALLASNRNGTDGLFGAGSGGGLLGGILLASLLRGNGGLFGGDNAGAGAATIGQIQQTLGDIKAAVPLQACETQAETGAAIGGVSDQINDTALAQQGQSFNSMLANQKGFCDLSTVTMQGFGSLGNALMQGFNGLGTLVMSQGQRTVDAVTTLSSKIDANRIADLEQQLTVAQLKQQTSDITRGVEINVSSVQNQLQQQQQQQNQIASLLTLMMGELQKNTNSTVAIGSTLSGFKQDAVNNIVR